MGNSVISDGIFYRVVSRSKSMSGGRRYIRVRNRAIANQDFPGENLDFS